MSEKEAGEKGAEEEIRGDRETQKRAREGGQ